MRGKKTATALRKRRHERVRKTVTGTSERPRLAVYRSLNHIYAQVIDDTAGHTVAAASDQDAEVRKEATKKKKTDVAGLVGAALGQRAKEKGITAVVFDRGGFRYHGRVKALAEAVRKAGVTF
ncbi:MAG: 50S ribosomal protein L18 [Chloroflexota bacterium]|nr:50S ribosomal protein L18 [Chloroflexota bacterium]